MLQGLISPMSLGSSWHKEALLGSVVYKVFSVFHYSVSMSVCVCVRFPPPLKHAEFTERNAWDQNEILFFIWKACSTKSFLSPSLPPSLHKYAWCWPSLPFSGSMGRGEKTSCDWCHNPAHDCWHPINQGETAALWTVKLAAPWQPWGLAEQGLHFTAGRGQHGVGRREAAQQGQSSHARLSGFRLEVRVREKLPLD